MAVGAAALAADRAAHGVAATGSVAASAVDGPWWVVIAGVALLAVTGALPAWRLAGPRAVAVFLAPCIGALVATVSAVVTVTVASEPLRWYVAFGAAVNAAALASTAGHHPRRPRSLLAPVALLAAVAAALGYASSALGRVAVTPQATHTWIALVPMLVRGHGAVTAGLSAAGRTAVVHLLSSPVAAGMAAVTWLVSGSHSVGAAVGVSAAVTAAAVGVAACAIGEVAPALLRLSGPGADATGGGGRTAVATPVRPWVGGLRVAAVRGAAVLAACGFVLAAVAAGGRSALGGDQTLLWSAALAGAAVLTLVLQPTGWRLRAALPLGALVALTAPLGALSAAVVVVAVTARRVAGRPGAHRGARRLIDVAGALVGLAAVGAWPAVAAVVGAGPPSPALPPGGGPERMHAAWRALGPTLWPAAAAVVLAAVGTVVLGRWRRRRGLAADAGLALVGAVAPVAAIVAAGWATPLVQPLRLQPLILAGMPLVVTGAAVVAVWTVVATAAAGAPRGAREGADQVVPATTGTLSAFRDARRAARGPATDAVAGVVPGLAGEGHSRPAATQVDGWAADVLHPSA